MDRLGHQKILPAAGKPPNQAVLFEFGCLHALRLQVASPQLRGVGVR